MAAQPEFPIGELIPRPERTAAALKAALAVVAPERLPQMLAEQTETITLAVESDSLDPLRGFLLRWAAVVEIERDPQTASRLRRAEYLMHTATDPAESRAHALAVSEIIRGAYRALGR
ncbi:hypothetical protein [Kitasatospora sp. NPDC059673]|uniref:hypothetical protein n=1 Tax=Kitasatospora sp. NPDC059673 TaxID=3346901 RepID=UPI0036AA2F57